MTELKDFQNLVSTYFFSLIPSNSFFKQIMPSHVFHVSSLLVYFFFPFCQANFTYIWRLNSDIVSYKEFSLNF